MRLGWARLVCFVAWPLVGCALFGGCQSMSETDLVAREMRMKEDQIYALQDYLAEYQQLICKYRVENESLREQLGDSGSRTSGSSTPATRNTSPPEITQPPLEFTPPPLTTPPEAPRSTGGDSRIMPDVSIPELNLLPFDSQPSSDESRLRLATHLEPGAPELGEMLPASERAERAFLSGETFANENGGPRILVDVAPLSAAGRAVWFQGSMSIMVLAVNDDGPPLNLARWDYTPEQVAAAKEESPDRYAMRFRLQLPSSVAIERRTELWVRLVHDDGAKVLTEAPITLNQPRTFASTPFETHDTGGDFVRDAGAAGNVDSIVVQTTYADDGWAIAKPGEKVIAMPGARAASDGWRIATEPIPVAVAESSAVESRPVAEATVALEPGSAKKAPLARPNRSVQRSAPLAPWSPDRPAADRPAAAASPAASRRWADVAPIDWSPER